MAEEPKPIPAHVVEAIRILNAEGVLDRIKTTMDDSLKDDVMRAKNPIDAFTVVQLFGIQEMFFQELGRMLEELLENVQQ